MKRSGFTLLEVLSGMMLIGLVILPLLNYLQHVARTTRLTSGRIVAETCCRAVLERFRAEPFAALVARLGSPAAGAAVIASDPVLSQGPGGEPMAPGVRRFAWVERGADARVAVLAAAVEWDEQGGARRHELRTVITDTRFPTGRDEVAP